MIIERTLSIIKPDATRRNLVGKILDRFETAGLLIVAQKRALWTKDQAEEFYAVHADRPFFGDLVSFMTSGPIVLQVLQKEDAVMLHRDLIGATDPRQAAPGTIRRDFAESIESNAVHGSDSVESACVEIRLCFKPEEIVG